MNDFEPQLIEDREFISENIWVCGSCGQEHEIWVSACSPCPAPKVYQTLVVDPPWEVKAGRALGSYELRGDRQLFGGSNVTDSGSRQLAYPSMSLTQIKSTRVPAAKNAHLYLWTINKYLPHAFDVMGAWGFTYSTTLVWAKKPMGGGLGGCYGLATEFCLFGRKGTLGALARTGRNWFDWKRPYKNGYPHHSAKPPEFYAMVEAMSPGPRIDMFARSERVNWDVWGNEVPCPVPATGENK